MVEIQRLIDRWQESRRVRLYRGKEGRLLSATPAWLLGLVGVVYYQTSLEEREWRTVEKLLTQTVQDVLEKIHHKLIYDINTRRYRYDEPLAQAPAGGEGDFIDRYTVTLEFPDEARKESFEKTYPTDVPEQLTLCFKDPRTIYEPLLHQNREELEKDLRLKPNTLKLSISPDSLNAGERKFVFDLHEQLSKPYIKGRYEKHEFYLMRNVQSLRSVGIYLESETRAFFPDFVLWVVHRNWTHILLIDPKGQTGITDWSRLEENEKVRIATGGHLKELARKLSIRHGKTFKVDSFILLRDSSEMGKLKAQSPTPDEIAMIERMKAKHVLRLDWHERNETGDLQSAYWNGNTYLDFMLGVLGQYN